MTRADFIDNNRTKIREAASYYCQLLLREHNPLDINQRENKELLNKACKALGIPEKFNDCVFGYYCNYYGMSAFNLQEV